ncbi:MAG: hypothetical protein HXY34_13195 [Candidatus Thorarchaeota archaeon]|nr:hypothetical protein [Candidatus Thorarchaeota archaeon]
MNAYFVIVLLSIGLFFLVWALGWLLERASHSLLGTTQAYGSRGWYFLVGPGVALHESSHALGCLLTNTKIVEFKPINVEFTNDGVVLGYVKYVKPSSPLRNAVINLAPVAVSLFLLVFFALGATYLVPDAHLGGEALALLRQLIDLKANEVLLNDPSYPVVLIVGFVYSFLVTFSGLTVLNPLFWIVAFLAMTIMLSNAPSDVDISNAASGLKVILVFELIWLVISYFVPAAGWVLYGLFEFVAVMFSLALAFAAVGYGFFFMVFAMSRLKTPIQILPFAACLVSGALLIGYPYSTLISIGIFALVTVVLLLIPRFRASAKE